MVTSIDSYKKAVIKLEQALAQEKNEFIRDSVIQRFEFCVELGWKTGKKLMGTSTTAPKDIIRELAQNQYIGDIDLWLRAIDMRNISSLTYNEELAEKVYAFALSFLPFSQRLAEVFEKK